MSSRISQAVWPGRLAKGFDGSVTNQVAPQPTSSAGLPRARVGYRLSPGGKIPQRLSEKVVPLHEVLFVRQLGLSTSSGQKHQTHSWMARSRTSQTASRILWSSSNTLKRGGRYPKEVRKDQVQTKLPVNRCPRTGNFGFPVGPGRGTPWAGNGCRNP